MEINSNTSFLVTKANTNYNSQPMTEKKQTGAEVVTSDAKAGLDVYTPSDPSAKKAGYENPTKGADAATLARLKAQSEQVYSTMKETVRQMLKSQGLAYLDATGEGEAAEAESAVENREEGVAESPESAQMKAAALIGEGGALSPEKLSDTIVDFAKSISGGDTTKLNLLREAIQKGFDEATKAWGGELPEITKTTFDLVQQKLDAWENGTGENASASLEAV